MSEKTIKGKSTKNLYNAETGLAIMINLYVIKYIYYHIEKADCFIEKKEKGSKPKSYEIYGNQIPMSRQRFDRINKGMTFEITANEANDLIKRYGIEERYFRKESPDYFEIEGLNLMDWQCFYRDKYKCQYKLSKAYEDNDALIKKKAGKIETALGEVITRFWDGELPKGSPLYAICYYFATGRRCNEISAIEQFRKAMRGIKYSDWNNVELEFLNDDLKLLKKHLNYINSVITIRTVMNEENQ